jgi:myo-inositol 2-dehydrogenase / D-chiro-inositol 1-dehydrogenase
VVIASSANSHATLTAACVEAGLPVFCEKPIAQTSAEAVELDRRLGGSSVPVQVGFQRRHDAAFSAVREAIARGELGVVGTVRCATLDPEPPPPA